MRTCPTEEIQQYSTIVLLQRIRAGKKRCVVASDWQALVMLAISSSSRLSTYHTCALACARALAKVARFEPRDRAAASNALAEARAPTAHAIRAALNPREHLRKKNFHAKARGGKKGQVRTSGVKVGSRVGWEQDQHVNSL